jgi:hypothetical protein
MGRRRRHQAEVCSTNARFVARIGAQLQRWYRIERESSIVADVNSCVVVVTSESEAAAELAFPLRK